MTLALQGKSRRRRALLAGAATMAVAIGGFVGLAGLSGPAAHADAPPVTPTATSSDTTTATPTMTATATMTATETATATSTATMTATATSTATTTPTATATASPTATATATTTPTTGTLVITESAGGAAGSQFSFVPSTNLNGGSTFLLDDDPSTILTSNITFAGLGDGTYTVTQSANSSFPLSSISCAGTPAFSSAGSALTVTFSGGGSLSCVFSNTPSVSAASGTISITKTFVGTTISPVGLQAAFSASGPGVSGFSLVNGGTQTFQNLTGSSYTFVEGAVPGWTLTSITCSGSGAWTPQVAASELSISLSTGQGESCTFVNTQSVTTGGIFPNGLIVPGYVSPGIYPTNPIPSSVAPVYPTAAPVTNTVAPEVPTAVPTSPVYVAPATTAPEAPSAAATTAPAAAPSAVAGVGVPGAPNTGTGLESSGGNDSGMLLLIGGLLVMTAGLGYFGVRRIRS